MSIVGEAFVRIRPDTTGFGRATATQVTRETRATERQVQQSSQRMAGYAKAALLGLGTLGVGVGAVLRSSVKAAEESQKVQAQLVNALDAQNISLKDNQVAIEGRTQALSQMSGFDDELITTTFINFVRRTGDVTKALNLNAIAVDVARGRNISLESSSALVTRASLGMAGALRRVGIAAKDGASATELLALLQQKYAGSAAAYGQTAAGAQERFAVALENTQEVIGAAVLPGLTKALNKATDWLNSQKNQEKVQKAVNTTTERGKQSFGALADGIGAAKVAYDLFSRAAEKLPGNDQTGFFKVMLTGNIIDQVRYFADATEQGAKALHLMKINADDAGPSLHSIGETLSETLAKIAAQWTALIPAARAKDKQGFADFPKLFGPQITDRQRLDAALAAVAGSGTPAEVAASQAIVDFDNRQLAYAQKRIDAGIGNLKAFQDAVIKYTTERRSLLDRVGQIAAANAAAAKAAREKRRQAISDAVGAGASGTSDASAAFGEFQGIVAGLIGSPAAGGGKVSAAFLSKFFGETAAQTEANLRTQIAAQSVKNEKKLIPYLQDELAADQAHLKFLKKIGATTEAKLQEELNIATIRRRIRDIRKKSADESGGFTLSELFAEAASEANQFGSNIGGPGSLSPQGGRGNLGKTIIVNQHIYGEQPSPAQALVGAAQAAKSLRLG